MRDDLCQIAQGSDANDRIGLSIRPISLSLKVVVASNSAATSSCFTRIVVFQSKKAETAAPSETDLIQDYIGSGSLAIVSYNHRNWANEDLYHVVLDDVITTSAFGQYRDIVQKEYLIPLGKCNSVDYLDASAALTGNKGGRLFCYLMSGEANTNPQTVTYHARLLYSDI